MDYCAIFVFIHRPSVQKAEGEWMKIQISQASKTPASSIIVNAVQVYNDVFAASLCGMWRASKPGIMYYMVEIREL